MSEQNAVLALKNAWAGAVQASATVQAMAATVAALPETTPVADLDLDTYRNVTLGQASAVLALRGLIEELQRKLADGKQI
jgi:hypothetical protein